MERARASLGGENMQSEGSEMPREGERQRMQPRGYGKNNQREKLSPERS